MKHKWTEEQVIAIKESLEHWYENLMMLQLNYLSDWYDVTQNVYIFGDDCALCKLYAGGGCVVCPLTSVKKGCGECTSPWKQIFNYVSFESYHDKDVYYKRLYALTKNMINALENLLK